MSGACPNPIDLAAKRGAVANRFEGKMLHSRADGEDDLDLPDRDFLRIVGATGGRAARGRLHALHPARPGDEGAMTGFAFTLLDHLAALASQGRSARRKRRPILWVQDRSRWREAGLPYGLGFDLYGLDPTQFVIVSTKTVLDALAATEIGLEIGGLDGVIAELPPKLPADMLAFGKRLALRAERSLTPCLLMHASAAAVASPVATRWLIAARAAVGDVAWEEPRAAVDAVLVKNRFGPTGRWAAVLAPSRMISDDSSKPETGASDVRAAAFSTPLSQPVDVASADRPGPQTARSRAA